MPKSHALFESGIVTRLSRPLVILLSLVIAPPSHAFSEKLAEYLKNRQTKEAYQWLIKHQDEQANNPQFNDWLAQLAMQLGQYPQAINALERLILLQPNHLGAQLDLVIAYLKLGNVVRARQEFNQLQQQVSSQKSVPPSAAETIAQLEQQLANDSSYRFNGLVQIGGGYDSNVNQGAENDLIRLNIDGQVPVDLELAPESTASEDAFSTQRLQLSLKEEPGANCGYQYWCSGLVLDVATRLHHDETRYDQYQGLLGGSLTQLLPERRSKLTGYLQYAHLSDSDTLASVAAEFSQRWRLSEQWAGYALYINNRHEEGSSLEDSQQSSFTLLGELDNGLYYSLAYGYHNQPGRTSGDTRSSYATLGYKTRLSNWYAQGRFSYSWEQDSLPYYTPLFGDTVREDTKSSLALSATRALSSHWISTLSFEYSDNRSNIPLFDRDRFEATISFSYLW